ncbi:phosphatidylinositol mannoside acyltransferase [Frankia sp. CNm7]|uniref:Phosphatidylinositol mannoside acyltransferase n=1 Tax=Frankia nepalensis TaxID=1836974 RepID=A0A937RH02_9ACTN|nr:phosphatidylinositol mannoside acyltransferase [Frankia nepalensis]MBL7494759.1 phosphatidylinositol mannoside acyltransferase [Frankia nepalensis]MBL7514020.1 phosphatidylinositol mannoside acyltransferase [Frankia nepalensis]MBL7521820.1 phosphatidylinositol mannoside acyltransferase [Frankia nepalensis]MBL7629952.1 phosphatidylinositol mannoside acyltransferase [Frankia nepalensis]
MPSPGRFTDLAYALGWRVVRVLPEPVAARGFAAAADWATRRGGRGVRRLRANLARVVPPGTDLDALTKAAMRSYARYWLEVFRLQDMAPERYIGNMVVQDEHYLRDTYAAGKGMILALPHMGNWEQAGAWLAGTGVPFTTVAERLRPESLFDRFVAFRESLGMEVIPLTGGAAPPMELLAERLRAGGCLCLLADRDLSARGVPVRFFGAEARMAAGPAALALRTGAPLLPVALCFEGDGWGCRIYPPIEHTDMATMTQALADAFAESIAEHPADWHMLQRIWPDPPEGEPAAAPPPPAEQPATEPTATEPTETGER